jgi:hypothetical protein
MRTKTNPHAGGMGAAEARVAQECAQPFTERSQRNQFSSEYVLAALHSSALCARLIAAEAETIQVGLRQGLISPQAALLWARDAGVLDLVSQDEAGSATDELMEVAP